MTATDLIEECMRRGVELTAAPGRLRVRAPGRLDPGLADRLKHQKDAILAALSRVCPQCNQPVDDRRRCWPCCNRNCSGCGRPTGSAFIELCSGCGLGAA